MDFDFYGTARRLNQAPWPANAYAFPRLEVAAGMYAAQQQTAIAPKWGNNRRNTSFDPTSYEGLSGQKDAIRTCFDPGQFDRGRSRHSVCGGQSR